MKQRKVYYYTDKEVGKPWPGPDADRKEVCRRKGIPWPRFVWYEWPGSVETKSPKEADVFVVRQRFSWLSDAQLKRLPYLKGREARHVFFDLNDRNVRTFGFLRQSIFLRSCCTQEILKAHPNTVLWPWCVDPDVIRHRPLPKGGFSLDVAYQAHPGYHAEHSLAKQFKRAGLKAHVKLLETFWPNLRKGDANLGRQLKQSYLDTMQKARLSLCPATNPVGATRIRLWEVMAMGRLSVHFNDKIVLPLSDRVDWNRCLVRLPVRALKDAGTILAVWLSRHTDADILERGRYASQVWEKYFAPGKWGQTAGMIVRERLKL